MNRVDEWRPSLSLLDVDPDMGRQIPEAEYAEARRRAIARVITVDGPRWDPAELAHGDFSTWLGLFVVDGLLLRRVVVVRRATCELFGAGDLLRPWDSEGDYDPLEVTVDWLVVQPARLAVLDNAFARRVARWPHLWVEFLRRTSARARYLSLTAAVTHLPRTHARLLLLFWLLADRWGRVTPEGISVRLPLTHQVLAMLVGSHRPTVTIALQKLARDGLVIRQSHERWLLTAEAVDALERASTGYLDRAGSRTTDAQAGSGAAGPGAG